MTEAKIWNKPEGLIIADAATGFREVDSLPIDDALGSPSVVIGRAFRCLIRAQIQAQTIK